MNEITKIHLGRQAFTIAVDAHKELQEYLRAIKRHMGDSGDAVEEVELRIAELLGERGVSGDKVVLLKDVEYVKTQLGEPGDFGDEADEAKDAKADSEEAGPRRLFRDTEHGMVSGVAAGLANYFHIDAVIVRILFIIATVTGGWGIPVYIILWLIIPEAKTSSERLQMQGKPVTVDAIKEAVERADVKGAAERAGTAVGRVVHGALKVILAVVGVALLAAGVSLMMALAASSIYFFLNHNAVVPFGIFPVGTAEYVLVGAAIATIAIVGLFLLLAGLTMIRRRPVLPGWVLAVIVALFLASGAIGTALGATTAPKIDHRYQAAHHSDVRKTTAFSGVTITGTDRLPREVGVDRRVSGDYKLEFRYMGQADPRGITVKETNPGHLEVNFSGFKADPACTENPCLFAGSELTLTIYAPADQQIKITGEGFWTDFWNKTDEMPAAPEVPDLRSRMMPVKPVLYN